MVAVVEYHTVPRVCSKALIKQLLTGHTLKYTLQYSRLLCVENKFVESRPLV